MNIGSEVTTIPSFAFAGCTGLTSVTIPNSVTSIGESAFYNCTGLTSVTIGDSVTSIGEEAFYNCTGLTSVTIGNSVTSIGEEAFYNCTGLTSVTIGNSVTSIGEETFYNCTGLTSVTIGNSVTSIGKNAFNGCSSLTSITIPNSVTSIGDSAFYNCTGLISVTIGDSVTSIGESAFYICTGLTSVTIGNSVTSIGKNAFNGCSSLTSVTIPNSVTSIGESAFYNCTGLTSVTIGDSVTSIGESAFYICTGLTSVTIGNSVTSIGDWAFGGCSGLTSVTIPNSVTSIGNNAFSYCTGLTSVTIPNSVTSIGWEAFAGCTSLTSITIGNSVTSIGDWAFDDCDALDTIYFLSSIPVTFTFGFDIDNCVISIPCGTLETYQSAWGSNYNFFDLCITQIAYVGVDSNGHNTVCWTPRSGSSAVGYHVYREGTQIGVYEQVGVVQATGATSYTWSDDQSNPAVRAYSYRLTEMEADGTESAPSETHTTMHLQINQGQSGAWNLSWTPYAGFAYSTYRIYRGATDANLSLLTTLPASSTTYSDLTADGENYYYQIEVVQLESAKSVTVSSRSNIASSDPEPQHYTLTVLSADITRGTVTGGGSYEQGETATLEAIANEGYLFLQWDDGSTVNPRPITVTGNATYTAYFAESEGIGDMTADGVTLIARDGRITISGADGRQVTLTDALGRIHYRGTATEPLTIGVPAAGIYLLQVDSLPAKRIAVVK